MVKAKSKDEVRRKGQIFRLAAQLIEWAKDKVEDEDYDINNVIAAMSYTALGMIKMVDENGDDEDDGDD